MTSVTEFGRQLLRTGDLDPVYVALHKAQLDAATLARLCLAYWCFYHLGLAAKIAEAKTPKKYWELMLLAAQNPDNPDGSKMFPRGGERRHYRGEQATKSMGELIAKYGRFDARVAVDGFIQPATLSPRRYTYNSVAASAQAHRGFGEWIAFKIADMSERVLGYDTDFSDCHLGIYKDPRQGAAVALFEWQQPVETGMIHPEEVGGAVWNYPISDAQLAATVAHYVGVFRKEKFKAPGGTPRLVNVQEIETVFCKYKSHIKGHYPPGKDTREITHGLTGWGDLAQQLQLNMPKVP